MDIIRGLEAPAWLVGLARGVLEAAIFGAFAALSEFALGEPVFGPLLLAAIRTAEGLADQVDPAKRRSAS